MGCHTTGGGLNRRPAGRCLWANYRVGMGALGAGQKSGKESPLLLTILLRLVGGDWGTGQAKVAELGYGHWEDPADCPATLLFRIYMPSQIFNAISQFQI